MHICKGKYFCKFIFILITIGLISGAAFAASNDETTLKIGYFQTCAGLDPTKTGAGCTGIPQNIFESLVSISSESIIEPALAKDWQWISDTEIQFELRENVKFHSGTPFTAEAACWNVRQYIDPEKSLLPYAMLGKAIASCSVKDKYTINLKLTKPDADFLYKVGSLNGLVMRDPGKVEELGTDFSVNPSGTGPFKFNKWNKGEFVLLEANEEWWGEGPYLDQIRFDVIPENASRVMALKQGAIDVGLNISPKAIEEFSKDPNYDVKTTVSARVVKVGFNYAKPIWQDPDMRKAISLAIDTKTITEQLIGSMGEVAKSLVSRGNWFYSPQGFVEFDRDKALEILSSKGWEEGEDGYLQKDDETLSVQLGVPPYRDFRNIETSQAFAEYLESIGIKTEINSLESGLFWSKISADEPPPFDLFYTSWGSQMLASHAFYNHYHGSNTPPGGLNVSRRTGQPLDGLMEAEFRIFERTLRKKVLDIIQEITYRETTAIPIYDVNNIWVMKDEVKDFEPNPVSSYWYLWAPVKISS